MDQRNLLMHQVMLGDRVRLDAYDKAMAEVMSTGAVVADIGAGTLPLTALALRRGAARVYAVEADPQLAAVAARIIQASGWTDRVTLVAGDARTVRLPERVDVVVAELMGNLGPEEDMSRLLRIVTRRNLRRPGGAVIPQRLVTYLAPVEFGDEGWGVWRDGFLDMALSVVQEHVEPAAQLHFFQNPPVVLGPPVPLVDSATGAGTPHPGQTVRLEIARPGRLQAVVGYFTATLAPGVTLSNFPSYPGCNWAVWVWPVRHTRVAAGDKVRIRVTPPAQSRLVTDWRLDCQLARATEEM
jgi:protein arginine N-methyltransferase 1